MRVSTVATSLLLMMFFGLMIRAYAKGMEINCGCFGPGETISWRTLLRDGALLAGSLTLGNNINSTHFQQLFEQGSDLIAPAPLQLDNTIPSNLVTDEFESLIHSQSYFGQATLDLFNQVFLTAGLRNDGSSTFGASKKRHYFPKASIAWNFTEAMNLGSIIPTGKLRLAYGETGQQPPVYSTIGGLVTGAFIDGWVGKGLSTSQNSLGGLTTSAIRPQPNLGPERSKELEGGIDLALFKNYADLGVTLYSSRTEGVILLTPLAPSTGFLQQASNAARSSAFVRLSQRA